ncbi:MAG: LamG-like jellyroll fold domain-containing protein [Chitinophagaceae bacterium]
MQKLRLPLQRIVCLLLLVCLVKIGNSQAQTLKLSDFAIWGGSASASSYNSAQGVFLKEKAKITGSIGSNHLVDAKENFTLTGNIFSGNGVSLKTSTIITGNITANKTAANFTGNVISGNIKSDFKGNLTAKGKIVILTATGTSASFVRGQVAVPAPTSTNYSGPAPTGGFTNTFTLPILPTMPANTAFDNQVGTATITGTQTITPGKYKKLALTGSKTLTFDGPGNYIFYNIDNSSTTNKFVFDFKNTTTGTINIFVIKDARFGKLSVSTKNGNFPSRIYTEVHGDGSGCDGYSVELQSPDVMPSGGYVWLGNIWAPNSGINVKALNVSTTPHIIGALWSAKQVDIKANLVLTYQAPAIGTGPSFIAPYYPPPTSGKVTAVNNPIGAELFSLSQNTTSISSIPQNEIFTIKTNKVLIEVVSKAANDATLKSQLITLGMTNAAGVAGTIDNGPHIYTISGYFPIASLTQLNNNTRIEYVRPLYPPISNAGQVTTQGDTTMRSHYVKTRFGLDGTGVKIGVISDSYNSKLSAQSDVDQGDLPGIKSNGQPNDNPTPVQIVGTDLSQDVNDEGRAMLQIAHDVAPKSKLAFRTGFLTAGDFAKGIQDLASPALPGGRCDVIVDDITYITEPFLRDGIVAQTVNQVVSQGVTYFSSAGNFGKQSYEGVFNGVTNTSVIPTGQIHRFGATSTDIYQNVNLKPGSYTIVLQWNDEFSSLGSVSGVQTDMDLYLVGVNGFTLFGFNRSNLLGDPFEVCPFTVTEETNAKVMIVRASGTANVRFKYIIFRGDATILDYQTGNSSIVGHPNADSAIAVGAMLYANIPQYTPVWPGVASFSSRGGTLTLQNGTTNTYAARNKPELIAPNGVNTTVNLGGSTTFSDGDPYPNFFGTSAAAPHAAAVGALLIQARKKYNLQTTVTPYQIRQHLQSSAGKFSYLPGNFSFEGGYGYVQADSAVQQIANAKPIISSLEAVVPGSQNGTLPFQVKIKGKYLTPTTKIYVGGVAVATTTVSADKTEATATVPTIPSGQNPAFQLSNAAKSVSGLDGGLSEELFFFSSRTEITVRAINKTRKYGLDNPVFTNDVLVSGVPIGQTTITLAALKLDGNNLKDSTIATPNSRAGLYGIVPYRPQPLDLNDPLLTQYSFTFVSGTLTVEKMPLKITPNNKQVKYGEDPGEITYAYELNNLAVPPSAALLDAVKDLHKQYLADNALVAISGLGSETPLVSNSDLTNMSVMASIQAFRNARKFALQNGQLSPLVDPIDITQLGAQRFIVDLSAQSLSNYIANPTGSATMIQPLSVPHARGLLNLKTLTSGTAKASVPNELPQPIVNGQLLAMVNGQLKAVVNGQLQALVNGQLMPLVNGQLVAMVNGQLKAVVNGQLLALVNGQVMFDDNGDVQIVQDLFISNGQLKAVVNGQLKAVVNGQLKAVVNGLYINIDVLANGQLKAVVNGVNTDVSYANGQLKAVVNGQLKAVVNGAEVGIDGARLINGQLKALVNGNYIPIANGQLQALVNSTNGPDNSQLLSMVNGQLMAVVNNEVTFVIFQNGQLKALVNGQLVDQSALLTNGQLKAVVNGQLQTANSATITNGQLKAVVNGEDWTYSNGQLKAVVNGQLKALVNNFDVTGANNNSKTVVLVDEDDINLQAGDIGGMFSVNMITGLGVGTQKLIPGAFINENFEVTYGLGDIEILALHITGDNKTKYDGEPNPPLSLSYSGFINGDNENNICSGNFVQSYITPASPVSISQLARVTTYTDVKLNNGTNVITVSPGDSIMLTGDRVSFSQAVVDADCPGCVTQHYFGMKDIFSEGFDANGSSGAIVHPFRAPKTPGVYYITQVASWQYNIFDDYAGNPDNDPANAIAVVIVSGTNKPYATTTAGIQSTLGSYPITLTGCTDFANYQLVYTPGILSVVTDPCLKFHWDGNRNYLDRVGNVIGTPTGGVSNLATGRVGGVGTFNGIYNQNNSLSFDGTGYIEAGTAGSVAGDGDFSVSAWVQTTSNDPMVIINQRDANDDGEYILKIGGIHSYPFSPDGAYPGKAYFLIYGSGSDVVDLISTTSVNDGNWHFIKAVREGTSVKLFIDGALEASGTTSVVVNLNGSIATTIGKDLRDNNAYFKGLIDDIKVSICGSGARPGSASKSQLVVKATDTKGIKRETKLYPNPASTMIRVQLETDVKSVNDFQVTDVVGKATRIGVKKINDGLYEIDISHLGKGVYFIKTNTTAGIKTYRFIKM